MSDKRKQEEADESVILLEDLDGDSNHKHNIQINADDEEMLLLSSSPSPSSSPPTNSKKTIPNMDAEPSGIQKSSQDKSPVIVSKTGTSGIIIEDSSDSSEEGNSVEVIGSEDEEMDDEESDSEESLSAFLDGKVQIFMAQGSFFIWNAEDVHMLREECRIVGKLVGCLPRAPRQNSQLGLPLQLMPEEAKLLEEIEAACVVEEVDAVPDDIGALRKSTFEAMREDNFKVQQNMYKESRKEEVRQNKHKIIEGKKAKKRKIQELENTEKQSPSSKVIKTAKSSESDIGINESLSGDQGKTNQSKEVGSIVSASDVAVVTADNGKDQKVNSDPVSSEMSESNTESGDAQDAREVYEDLTSVKKPESASDKMQEMSSEMAGGEDNRGGQNADGTVTLADSGDEDDFDVDELVTEETHVKHSLIQLFTENPWKESVKRPKQWIFPLSQKESLRYEVFRDLWKKGYFLTSGSKFGGDFLVYPGDPARFHSHFIAVCIDKTVDLSALDIVSLGRLGSNVRKSVLLCAFNKSRQIVYTSLQWTGIV